MRYSQDGAKSGLRRPTLIHTTVLLAIICCPALSFGQRAADNTTDYDFQSLVGQWKVVSARRGGRAVESLMNFHYFIDPGLMRWADPSKRSEETKLPLLMGRRIEHHEGDTFEASTIFPPNSTSGMELRRDGDQLILVTDPVDEDRRLVVRMKKISDQPPRPPKDKMVDLAIQALKDGRYNAAYQFSQLQLINFPDDDRGAALLGASSMRTVQADGPDPDRVQRAREQAAWAVERQPDNNDLRKEFAQFLYFIRDFGPASTQFEELRQRGVLSVEQLVTYAQCEVLLSHVEKSKQLLEEATGYDTKTNTLTENVPEQPNPGYLTLAILMMKLGNPTQGDQIMETLVEQFPESSMACLHHGRYQLLKNEKQKALKSFKKALALAPEDRDALLVNIEVGLSEEGDETDNLLARAIQLFGREPVVLTLACARASVQKDFEQTLALANEGLAKTPKSMPLHGLRTQAQINLKNWDDAAAAIAEMPDLGFHGVSVEIMRARLLIAQEKLDDADTIITRLGQIEPPPGALPQLMAVRELLADAKRKVGNSE